ncbi:ferredoxin [Hylemonella gracilis str. Niagara R]|uniref:Ferredoxin n=1 Tax=Hylemonella gracilis str. Niagara R TaxID=1458275 RepID=A0A016XKP8_9BURK|nr:2Fe-2S iron-sulfur cluster binding domain-containing protein [Hylemonella gracilis]EYC52117.1 ferredoxin [Hylemonella gracilis str. Niagara R]
MNEISDRHRFQGRCQDAFDLTQETVFDAWRDRPLLHAMEAAGIPWPSSCRNGTCRTCVGRLLSGGVRYEIEWPGLSREEKDEGYVLPCAAYPCSDVVLREGY